MSWLRGTRRRALGMLAALGAATSALDAQGAAQTVRLQIRPRVGDTIPMRLDQSSELTGTRRTGSSEATNSMVSDMRVYSRALVEGATSGATTMLAITDSAFLTTTDQHQRGKGETALPVMRVRMRVMPDGTVEIADGEVRGNAAEMLALMPGAFPKEPVSVGDTWTREMPLPSSGTLGSPAGKLRATFRLDSLGRGGDLAYLSMRGEMIPLERGERPASSPVLERGKVSGTMMLDRRRGWLTESRFDITLHSSYRPAAASGAATMRFQMRVTQHMRTLDRR